MNSSNIKHRTLTCIVCPRGCTLQIELCDGEVKAVSGNLCKRGSKYAEDECVNPMRTVTTTVKTDDGGVVAVKTEKTIPKEKMFDCMQMLSGITLSLPVIIGDTVIEDCFGSKVIVTQNRK